MKKINRVIIFTEGGDNIGFGHITRCFALYEELIGREIETIFVVYGNNIDEILEGKEYVNIDWKNIEFLKNFLQKDDYIIIDSYLANLEIYNFISNNTKKCMYIDDNNRLKYPKGVILNPVLYEDLEYETTNHILRGKDYIIVRKEFLEYTQSLEKSIDILITLGGTDIRNLTPELIKILQEINPNLNIAIVIGKTFHNKEEIETLKTDKINLFYNISATDMRNLILKSKFVICGCGQSINEMLILKCNFLPILIADNQLRNYNFLLKKKIVKYAINSNNLKEMKKSIENFLQDKIMINFIINKNFDRNKNIIDSFLKYDKL